MKALCDLSLKFDIINYINKKYNKHYMLHDIHHIIFGRDNFIIFMSSFANNFTNDCIIYIIKYDIDFS